jgi:hypothetical protein
MSKLYDELLKAAREVSKSTSIGNMAKLNCAIEAIEKTPPQQNAEEFTDYDPGALNDYGGGNILWWTEYIHQIISDCNDYHRENYAQSVGVSEEEWFKLISKLDIIYAQEHSEMQGLTMSKEDLAEAGKVSDHYEKRKIELIKQSLSTQPQPKEEEKCKHPEYSILGCPFEGRDCIVCEYKGLFKSDCKSKEDDI